MSDLHIVDQIKQYSDKVQPVIDGMGEYKSYADFHTAYEPYKKEAEKMIELILFNLIAREDNFYGQFIIRMNRKLDIALQAPAAVSFKGLYFELSINPLLIFHFTLDEIKSILIHEVFHVCNNHITRGKMFRQRAPHYLVNVAMDLAINQFISNLPKDCVHLNNIEHFVPNVDKSLILPNLSFEEYLEIFLDVYNNNEETKKFVDGKDKSRSSGGRGQRSDEELSDEEKEKIKEAYGNGGYGEDGSVDSHEVWDDADSTADDNESKNMARKLFNDAKQNSRGTVPGSLQEAIDRLFTPPTISWQQLLRKYSGSVPVPYKKTITRKDRRQPKRNDLKGKLNDRMVEIYVAIDTSGSMSSEDIIYALSEVCDIVKNVKSSITVLECDTQINREYTIKTPKDIKPNVTGRGKHL